MGDVLLRNVDERMLKRLKQRAKRHNRSLQAEIRMILGETIERDNRWEEAVAVADAIRERTRGTPQSDSTEIIRAARDSR